MKDFVYKIKPSVLKGKVTIDGAKNSALKLQTVSLLTDEKVVIHNLPTMLSDVEIHNEMLKILGKEIVFDGNTAQITSEKKNISELKWDGRSIRNTLLILGALLAKNGIGKVPLPGGCKLGERKYDLHVMIMEKMGAIVWEENDMLCAKIRTKLNAADIILPIRSTGATENAIIMGTLASGITTVWNPHIRPEVIDMIDMLNGMGADIEVRGQESIVIRGKETLHGVEHTVIPDNMEALTWLIASVITNGDIEIENFPKEHLEIPLIFLRESGSRFFSFKDNMIVRGGKCYPIEISTGPYPGINSDMQPLFALYSSVAKGESKIIDLRFPGRYNYMDELKKMGVEFSTDNNLLTIHGGKTLKGSEVKALDLRAGITLTLAGLIAKGETIILDAWQVERGYNNIVQKLISMGGNIEKVEC